MSLKESARKLIKLLEKLPEEKLANTSFKQVQMERFAPIADVPINKPVPKQSIVDIVNKVSPYAKAAPEPLKEEFTQDAMLQQIKSLNTLQSNQYRDYYYVGDKLLKPKGNPNYYERLLSEINGEGKENFFTGMRTVILGK